jgi:1-pyrroline-4-hydroxy-2-carboxylate deaminase
MSNVFAGVMPALMTPCKPDRTPDFRALTRKGRELIEAGMSAVVYCGSMGDWPLLTDEQRMQGVEHLVDTGVPVIVGTGAQNSQRAAALARHAKKVGARGLMIIPRVLSRGASPAAQRAHFAGVLEAAVDLPSAHLVGFKEFGGAASLSYAAEHIAGASPDISLLVGVDTQVFQGFVNCGAVGAITGIGNVLPKETLHLVSLCQRAAKGDPESRRLALELEGALATLSAFDEGTDLVLFFKHLMVLRGDTEYALHFNESDALSDSQKRFAEAQLRLFQTWYGEWRGAKG